MSSLGPVAIFACSRPDHLRNTLGSLMNCEGLGHSPLIVYCDGQRDDNKIESIMAWLPVSLMQRLLTRLFISAH